VKQGPGCCRDGVAPPTRAPAPTAPERDRQLQPRKPLAQGHRGPALGDYLRCRGAVQQQDMITTHADVVGSLLRPPWLLEAQERLGAGQITRPAYKSVEDRAVDEAVAQQEPPKGLPCTVPGLRETRWRAEMEWTPPAVFWVGIGVGVGLAVVVVMLGRARRRRRRRD
jgi:hypothetical protein